MTAKRRKKKAPAKRSRQPARAKKPAKQSGTPKAVGAPHSSTPRKTLFDLPPLELECMKALWALNGADPEGVGPSVREIRDAVARTHRRLAYTTVETIMDRLTRKRMVVRERKGRAHRYTAVYRLEQARAEGVIILLKHFFGGSRRALQAYLSGSPLPRSVAPSPRPSSPPSAPSAKAGKSGRSRTEKPPIDTSLL